MTLQKVIKFSFLVLTPLFFTSAHGALKKKFLAVFGAPASGKGVWGPDAREFALKDPGVESSKMEDEYDVPDGCSSNLDSVMDIESELDTDMTPDRLREGLEKGPAISFSTILRTYLDIMHSQVSENAALLVTQNDLDTVCKDLRGFVDSLCKIFNDENEASGNSRKMQVIDSSNTIELMLMQDEHALHFSKIGNGATNIDVKVLSFHDLANFIDPNYQQPDPKQEKQCGWVKTYLRQQSCSANLHPIYKPVVRAMKMLKTKESL